MTTKDEVIIVGEITWRTLLTAELEKTGGDPSHLFEILESVVEEKAWNELPGEDGKPLGSLLALIETPKPYGSGQSAHKILALLNVEHRYEQIDDQRRERMRKLKQAIEGELIDKVDINGVKLQSFSEELKLSNPELADKILSKKMLAGKSSNAESRVTIQVPIHDLEKSAKALRFHLSEDEVISLIQNLLEAEE